MHTPELPGILQSGEQGVALVNPFGHIDYGFGTVPQAYPKPIAVERFYPDHAFFGCSWHEPLRLPNYMITEGRKARRTAQRKAAACRF